MKKTILACASALALSAGMAQAVPVEVDLGFIIDESGSVGNTNYVATVNALQQALKLVPNATADVAYTIGVVSFGSVADTVIAPIRINSQADRDAVDAALQAEKLDYANAGSTNYFRAIEGLRSIFTSLGDVSIANFATDGNNNSNFGAGIGETFVTEAQGMISDGWDAMSFEAINTISTGDVSQIGFDSTFTTGPLSVTGNSGLKDCGTTSSVADTANPLGDCFIVTTSFLNLQKVFEAKIVASVTSTGGNPNNPVVPLPAGLPLLLGGLGAFAMLRRKKA